MVTLITVCGLAGAGKTTLGQIIRKQLDIPHYQIEQILVDECKKNDIEPNRDNKRIIGKKLGLINPKKPMFFFEASYKYMRSIYIHPSVVFFDAIRSPRELHYLHENEGVFLIGVCLDKAIRHNRLKSRTGMLDKQINDREFKELGITKNSQFNVGLLLGLADHFVLTPRHQNKLSSYGETISIISELLRKQDKQNAKK